MPSKSPKKTKNPTPLTEAFEPASIERNDPEALRRYVVAVLERTRADSRTELGASPYVAAFKEMGIPGADHLMNAVVLTAVLSCLNSGLYTASRMLFVLAGRREAPAAAECSGNSAAAARDEWSHRPRP